MDFFFGKIAEQFVKDRLVNELCGRNHIENELKLLSNDGFPKELTFSTDNIRWLTFVTLSKPYISQFAQYENHFTMMNGI